MNNVHLFHLRCASFIVGSLIVLSPLIYSQEQSVDKLSNARGDFISWWKEWKHSDQHRFKIREVELTKLPKADSKYRPRQVSAADGYIIEEGKGYSILVFIPTASPKEPDYGSDILNGEELNHPTSVCTGNQSWLVVLPSNVATPIDLNPHCNEVYGPEDVTFDIFSIPSESLPLISVVTNGPACVPSDLYGYDKQKKQYRFVSNKCGV